MLTLAVDANVHANAIQLWGAWGFGLVLGWFLYFVNRHRKGDVQLSDVVTVLGAVGGAAVTALFPAGTDLFGAYGVGLAMGFFSYFIVLLLLVRASMRRADGAFDWEWFLDGRCRKPRADQQTGDRPLGGVHEGGARGGAGGEQV